MMMMMMMMMLRLFLFVAIAHVVRSHVVAHRAVGCVAKP